jgi:putative transposase
MRPSKFTEKEIEQAFRQVEGGTPAVQVCRNLGITETTFYRWRHKYDRAGTSVTGEVRQLREENQRLKQIVANLLLDNERIASRGKKSTDHRLTHDLNQVKR